MTTYFHHVNFKMIAYKLARIRLRAIYLAIVKWIWFDIAPNGSHSFIYLFSFVRCLQFHANSISTVARTSGPFIFESSCLLLFKAKCAHKLSRWVRWCGNWLKPIVESSAFSFFLIVCNGIDNTFQRATIKILEFQVHSRLVTFSTCDIRWCIKKSKFSPHSITFHEKGSGQNNRTIWRYYNISFGVRFVWHHLKPTI